MPLHAAATATAPAPATTAAGTPAAPTAAAPTVAAPATARLGREHRRLGRLRGVGSRVLAAVRPGGNQHRFPTTLGNVAKKLTLRH